MNIDDLVASVISFGESNDFSIVLNDFSVVEIGAAKSLKIILNFNMLIVERGIGRFISNIIALRRFLYLEVPKLHNLRCTLDNGELKATQVELSTNVTEQFGTGYNLILPVTVFISYL